MVQTGSRLISQSKERDASSKMDLSDFLGVTVFVLFVVVFAILVRAFRKFTLDITKLMCGLGSHEGPLPYSSYFFRKRIRMLLWIAFFVSITAGLTFLGGFLLPP